MCHKRILLVDDEEDILDILSIHLESLGWDIDYTTSPLKALDILKDDSYFLVITDIAMPEMGGDELIELIARRHPALSLAVMTGFGYDPSHSLLNLNKKYECPIILKPFNFKDKIIEKEIDTLWKKYKSINNK